MKKWFIGAGLGMLATLAGAFAMGAVPFVQAESSQSYRYVALGDSVAAGAGLAAVSNATPDDLLCQRSASAYSQLIAAHYNITAENVACTAAKVNDGVYGSQEVDGVEFASQLDAAFQSGTPDLMTMTVGANDLRWTSFIGACAAYNCDRAAYRSAARVLLADLTYELNRTLLEVKVRSDERTPIVAMSGYYTLLDGECTAQLGIDSSERAWLNTVGEQLNDRIERAASNYNFATYVPIDFSGHGVCSQDSWLQDASDTAPYHPTEAGQRAIADAFIALFQRDY